MVAEEMAVRTVTMMTTGFMPKKLKRPCGQVAAFRNSHRRRAEFHPIYKTLKMTDCAICFSEVTKETGRTVMSCGHEYHMRCLFQWLQKPDGTGNCPCCRHEPTEHERLVPTPADDDSDSEYSDDDASIAADPTTFTALMRAAGEGDAALVERLLATGGVGLDGEGGRLLPVPLSVLLEERDGDGDTALVHAIVGEHLAIVRMLLAAGANMDNRSNGGCTPLIWAITNCEDDNIAMELIARGCDLRPVTEEENYSALQFAACYDKGNLVRSILERGVGRLGEALHTACCNGARSAAAILLEAGVDPDYRCDERAMTPLMQCVSNEPDAMIVSALLDNGADVNTTDSSGWNALMWMTRSDDAPDPDIMAAILDAQAHWERGADGRWRQVMQSWGEGDAAPPPYTLAEHTRAAARRIQAVWRGFTARRRYRCRLAAAEDEAAATALCYLRLQLTVPAAPAPERKPVPGDWFTRRMTQVV